MKADIVGAGMAGLLAAAMLRKECSRVYEKAPELPNNHSAVLRFRSSVVADVLNIPFKEVTALKASEPWKNPIADAMAYSRKTNGTATLRSMVTNEQGATKRYIAPKDLVQRMHDLVEAPVQLGASYDYFLANGEPVISTIPMPALMTALDWGDRPEFQYCSGENVIIELEEVDAYCSLYVPDPVFPAARISITGNEMVAECYGSMLPVNIQPFAERCAQKMGLSPDQIKHIRLKKQQYAKILPIDEHIRKRFITWASEEHGIYSLGRYATWRPGLLLDDVVNDVRVIQRLIHHSEEIYDHKIK